MRRPRISLRTMMITIVFLALALTVVVQSVQLRQALLREQAHRRVAELQRAQAEAQYRQAQAVLDQMRAGVAKQQPKPQEGRKEGGAR